MSSFYDTLESACGTGVMVDADRWAAIGIIRKYYKLVVKKCIKADKEEAKGFLERFEDIRCMDGVPFSAILSKLHDLAHDLAGSGIKKKRGGWFNDNPWLIKEASKLYYDLQDRLTDGLSDEVIK